MKSKYLLLAMLSILILVIGGCGSNGGAGLNGTISVTAVPTGSVIRATATYTNPTQTNLSGVQVDFSVQIGGQIYSLGSQSTNSAGVAVGAFTPPSFSGTQTITVIAKTDNLRDIFPLTMSGTTLTITAPLELDLTTSLAGGSSVPFSIPPSASFVTITDPFGNNISNHAITISAHFTSGNAADTLAQPNDTTTSSAGTALFPGTSGTLITPATVNGANTMTITWTVTDTVTNQSGTGISIVKLTKTS